MVMKMTPGHYLGLQVKLILKQGLLYKCKYIFLRTAYLTCTQLKLVQKKQIEFTIANVWGLFFANVRKNGKNWGLFSLFFPIEIVHSKV